MAKKSFMESVTLLHSLQPNVTYSGGDLTFSCTDTNIAQTWREDLGLCLLKESGFSSLY